MKGNERISNTELDELFSISECITPKQVTINDEYKLKYKSVWKRVRMKLRFKLFLSKIVKGALSQERKGQIFREPTEKNSKSLMNLIIVSDGKFKILWNIIMFFVIFDTAFIMPFETAFFEIGHLKIKDIMIDLLFLFNFFINCFTTYYEGDILIKDKKKIIFHYLRNGMLIDILCCFPFNLIIILGTSISDNTESVLRLIRLSKIFKILRLSRLIKVFQISRLKKLTKNLEIFLKIRQTVFKLLISILKILISVHIFSCLWYFSSKIYDFNPETWVSRYNLLDENIPNLYITSIYWVISTLSTVGYGDIVAYTLLEKILSIIWMFASLYIYGFIIGSLSAMVKSSYKNSFILSKKMEFVDSMASNTQLSKEIVTKIKKNLRNSARFCRFSWMDKEKILEELPKKLRFRIATAMYGGAGKKLIFFKQKDIGLVSKIIPLLTPCVINSCECVYEEGFYADELYFVVKGQLVYIYKLYHVHTINIFQYFGDIELILQVPRRYTAKSISPLELLRMSKDVLIKIKNDYVLIWEELKNKALETESSIIKLQQTLVKTPLELNEPLEIISETNEYKDPRILIPKIIQLRKIGKCFETRVKLIQKKLKFLKVTHKRSKSY